jgi:hypothetical protein
VIRKHDTGPDTPETALRRRMDGVDERLAALDVLTGDVTALGHGLAELTNRVTALTQATNHAIIAGPTRAGDATDPDTTDDTTDDDTGGEEGQPDWLTVTDPDEATGWLTDALVFADDVLARFPRGKLPACWPVHGPAVVEVLALQRQWADAYTSPDPGAVSDLLGRWLPGTVHRLRQLTGECEIQRAHQEKGRNYRVPTLEPGRVARWWVESRGLDPTATVAFAMTAVT